LLVFIAGTAGVGKSAISKEIARELNNTFLLDRDTVGGRYTEELLAFNGLSKNDRDSKFYHNHCRDLEYETTFQIAIENLNIGKNVIITSPFTKELQQANWLKEFTKKYRLQGVKVKLIIVTVDSRDTIKQRIVNRALDRDYWKVCNWDNYEPSINDVPKYMWGNDCDVLYFKNNLEINSTTLSPIVSFINKR
jgi:predicted kinase